MSTNFKFFIEMVVRFRDLDAMGHVNNSVYLTYFEEVRGEYLREVGQLNFDSHDPPTFIVGEILCRYRSACKYRDRIKIYCRAAEFGRASFKLAYEIRDAASERVIAEGYSTLVGYDYRAGKTKPIDDELRERLNSYEEA